MKQLAMMLVVMMGLACWMGCNRSTKPPDTNPDSGVTSIHKVIVNNGKGQAKEEEVDRPAPKAPSAPAASEEKTPPTATETEDSSGS